MRIFVDMDGTLAKWNNVEYEQLFEQGYYRNLEPNNDILSDVNRLIHEGKDVYILSCVLPESQYALEEKKEWLKEYVPDLPEDKYIFVPYGQNKADYLKKHYSPITNSDYLVDDYTKNLQEWKDYGGVGIKYLNGINHTRGTWKGLMVHEENGNIPTASETDLVSLLKQQLEKASMKMKVKMVKMAADIDATRNHRIRGIVPTEDGKYLFIEITKADRVDKKYTNCKTMKEYRQKYPNPNYIRVDFCFRVDIPKEHFDNYSPEFKGFLYSHYDLAYTNENIVELLQRLNPNITEIELTDDNYIEKFCEECGFFKLYDDRLQHSFEPINIMSLDTLGNCNVKFLYTCFASDGTKYSEESSGNFKINDLINEFGKEAIAPLVQSYTASRPFKNSEMKEKFLKFVKEIFDEKIESHDETLKHDIDLFQSQSKTTMREKIEQATKKAEEKNKNRDATQKHLERDQQQKT